MSDSHHDKLHDEATIATLRERISQFQAAITRIAAHVGACCAGVDLEHEKDDTGKPFGPGGHTAYEIIRKIDERVTKSASGAMTPTDAANVVLGISDQTVMSKYATQAECRAARDALWYAAEVLSGLKEICRAPENSGTWDPGGRHCTTCGAYAKHGSTIVCRYEADSR